MTAVSETRVVPRLKTRYREEIVGALRTEREYHAGAWRSKDRRQYGRG